MSLNGYDISNNQGDINNSIVPGDFVIIKATEGVGYTDPNCDANYQQAKAAGKLLGVYHFARPDGNNPVSEANWFVSQIRGYIGEAVLVLDFETNPKSPVWAKAFLDRVYELERVRCWIYMSQSVANGDDWSSVLVDYSLWVAAYGANTIHTDYAPSDNISVNGNWNIAAWQYTSNGHLPNWSGALDLNVFYGDAEAWRKYARPVAPTAVAPEVVAPVVEPAPVVVEPVVVPTPETIQEAPVPVVEPSPVVVPVVTSAVAPKSFWQKLWLFLLGFIKEIK